MFQAQSTVNYLMATHWAETYTDKLSHTLEASIITDYICHFTISEGRKKTNPNFIRTNLWIIPNLSAYPNFRKHRLFTSFYSHAFEPDVEASNINLYEQVTLMFTLEIK